MNEGRSGAGGGGDGWRAGDAAQPTPGAPASPFPDRRGAGLWRLLPDVHPRERARFRYFAGLLVLLHFSQTLGLSGTEALFLAELGAEKLALAFVLAAAFTVLGTTAYALVVGRSRNDRLFVAMLLMAAAALVGLVPLLDAPAALFGLFGFFYLAQAVFLTHFRTFATDFFDTLSAKRVFPLFAVGASTGGALGGATAALLAAVAPPQSLLIGWAVGLLATAGVLRAGRTALRRWGPIGIEEADESSVEGLRGALRVLNRSPLARALTVSVVGMVFSLSLLHYLSSELFAAEFPSAEELAAFFGIYLALSNLLEIALALHVTPWLVRRLGVGGANLIHPVLTLASFLGLLVDPRLHVAVLARANRELVENVLAGEIRNLSYNALPFRFRGSLRALLEGIVFYASMSVAGGALLLAGDAASLGWLATLGLATALLYGAANWRVQREYLASLVEELRAGRLEVPNLDASLGGRDLAPLAAEWEEAIGELKTPPRSLLELAPFLAAHGQSEAVARALRHPAASVRCACIASLASCDAPELGGVVREGLRDPSADVRLAAARAAGTRLGAEPELLESLRQALDDRDPRVRAELARYLGERGVGVLRELAASADPDEALPALRVLPTPLCDLAHARVDDPDASIRSEALLALARCGDGAALGVDRIAGELEHADARVRAAAAQLAPGAGEMSAGLLARSLDDEAREVREAAAESLCALGDAGVAAAAVRIADARGWAPSLASIVLTRAATPEAQRSLARALRARVLDAWHQLVALRLVPDDGSVPARFLRLALEDACAVNREAAFQLLELTESPAVVRSVRRALRMAVERQRADAIEVLTHLGDRDSAHLLAALVTDGPLEDRLRAVEAHLTPPRGLGDVLRRALESADPFLRMAAEHHAESPHSGSEKEIRAMERLLALRKVPLFASLGLDQLDAISRSTTEVDYHAGEIVVRQGEHGIELFVILEGEVEAFKNYDSPQSRPLRIMRAGDYFGEMAILESAPRSATIVVTKDSRMLALDGERFNELILQAPEIAFEMLRMLSVRLRGAEEQRS